MKKVLVLIVIFIAVFAAYNLNKPQKTPNLSYTATLT